MVDWPEKTRPGFVMFFNDERPDGYGLGLPEDRSYHDFPSIREYMQGVLVHPGNFLGLIDQFGETLQFFVNGDESLLIEFVVPAKKGSMTTRGTLADGLALVDYAGPSLGELDIPGVTFTPW